MYVMQRIDLVFKSKGEDIRGQIDGIRLNKVLDLFSKETISYRAFVNDEFYDIEKEDWYKLKEIYKEILEKEIDLTNSYKIETKNGTFYYIDEEDYCSLVKKVNIEDYNMDGLTYRYYIEGKKDKGNIEFEISKEVFDKIEEL